MPVLVIIQLEETLQNNNKNQVLQKQIVVVSLILMNTR